MRSGQTDLRGLFIADNVRGKATIIARAGESRYAFFRGETWLGAPPNAPATSSQQSGAQRPPIDYQDNLNLKNEKIQESKEGRFDQQRRQAPAKAYKRSRPFEALEAR